MATITVRIPDEKHERLKLMARRHGISLNKLFEELSTSALAELDVETRFLARARRGNPEKALEILGSLD
jgi:plasmid stability protein